MKYLLIYVNVTFRAICSNISCHSQFYFHPLFSQNYMCYTLLSPLTTSDYITVKTFEGLCFNGANYYFMLDKVTNPEELRSNKSRRNSCLLDKSTEIIFLISVHKLCLLSSYIFSTCTVASKLLPFLLPHH